MADVQQPYATAIDQCTTPSPHHQLLPPRAPTTTTTTTTHTILSLVQTFCSGQCPTSQHPPPWASGPTTLNRKFPITWKWELGGGFFEGMNRLHIPPPPPLLSHFLYPPTPSCLYLSNPSHHTSPCTAQHTAVMSHAVLGGLPALPQTTF